MRTDLIPNKITSKPLGALFIEECETALRNSGQTFFYKV